MPIWLESYPEAWHLLSPSKSDVHSDWWTSPVWLENFLATKRDCGEFTHLLCIVEFAFPFSCCNFCDLYFVIPFTCFPFCVSRRSEYMSARRIAYAWLCINLVPRVLRFYFLPLPLLCFAHGWFDVHVHLLPRISTSSLVQRWLPYFWAQWCFACTAKQVELLHTFQVKFERNNETSCAVCARFTCFGNMSNKTVEFETVCFFCVTNFLVDPFVHRTC